MSASVNLLPPEIEQQRVARRVSRLTVVAVAAWLAMLGSLYVVKDGQVDDARARRDGAQARVAVVEQEVAALDEYAKLAAKIDARNTILASAMADEVSWARILNDLSLAFPADASMTTLTAALTEPAEPVPGAVKLAEAVGDVAFTGYSVERFAPGVEGLLLDFENATGFVDTYLTTAAVSEKGTTEVTDFNGKVRLDDNARTGRYDDGLPMEVTQ